jgi:hypothetical protein
MNIQDAGPARDSFCGGLIQVQRLINRVSRTMESPRDSAARKLFDFGQAADFGP